MTISVVSKSSDVLAFKNLKSFKEIKFYAASCEAKSALQGLGLTYREFDVSLGKKDVKTINRQTMKLLGEIQNNPEITKSFTVANKNIWEFIFNRFYFYLIRMSLGYLGIEKLKKYERLNHFTLNLLHTNIFENPDSPSNQDFFSLPLYLWSLDNQKTTFILKRKITKYKYYKALVQWNINKINAILNSLIYLKSKFFYKQAEIIFILPAGHAVKLVKLFKNLDQKKISYILIVHNLNFDERIKLFKSGVNFIHRQSLLSKTILEETKKISISAESRWNRAKENTKLILRKTDKQRFFEKAILYRIDRFASHEIKQVLSDWLIAKFAIDRFEPKILVTSTDPDSKITPFVAAAKDKNIITVNLQHGAYASPSAVRFKSDKIYVWGKYYRDWFNANYGNKNREIIICGSPFFDNFRFNINKLNRRVMNTPSVLILLSGIITMHIEKELEGILQELLELRVKEIFVRSHPWQKVIVGQNLVSRSGRARVVMANGASLSNYLNKSQVVITTNTTAGFEALIKGIPIVYWDYIGNENLPFRMGGIPIAKNPESVLRFTSRLLEGKYSFDRLKIEKLINHIFYNLDGRSTSRVANRLAYDLKRKNP